MFRKASARLGCGFDATGRATYQVRAIVGNTAPGSCDRFQAGWGENWNPTLLSCWVGCGAMHPAMAWRHDSQRPHPWGQVGFCGRPAWGTIPPVL